MSVNMRDEVLASIDSMNELVQESEFSVLCTLLDQADKASMILEQYDGDYDGLDMFAIYQEAEEATQSQQTSAVQQGNPSGEASAEVGKKPNIFVRVWEFIKKVIKSVGDFIKRCWSGTTVAAETVSEKTGDIIDKIAGKDESWIKEHGTELGLSAAGVALAISIVGIINREKIKQTLTTLSQKMSTFFTNFKGIYTLDFTGTGISTNINVDTIPAVIKNSGAIFKAAKSLASNGISIPQVLNQFNQLQNTPNLILDSAAMLEWNDVNDKIKSIQEAFVNAGIAEGFDENTQPQLPEGANEANTSKLSKLFSALGGIIAALSSVFKGLAEKIKNLVSKNSEADSSTEGTGENEGTPEDTSTAGGETETETDTTAGGDEEVIEDEIKEEPTAENNEQQQGDVNQNETKPKEDEEVDNGADSFNESAETKTDEEDDDEVVEESYSGYYYR